VDSDSLKVLKTLTTITPHTDMIKGIVAADNGRIFSAGYDALRETRLYSKFSVIDLTINLNGNH
jgi:hypothetical protein